MEEERQAEAVMQPDCLHACSPLTDSLLLLRCRPDASRTHGFTLKEALVFLPRSGVHLCVCVCVLNTLTTLIKGPALRTSLANRHRTHDGQERGVYQPGRW